MTQSVRSVSEHDALASYPHLVEMGEHAMGGGYSADGEFEFGLDLILEGLSAFE